MNFNIHNLLFFKVKGANKRYLSYLGTEYSFFRTESNIDPDIEIIITDSISPVSNSRRIGSEYFVGDGYLYCRDKYKVARWSLSIDDLDGKTVVHFSGGIWGEHILKDFIIEPLIGFKLASKGICTLHASATAINDEGFIFAGGPKAGKTSSVLSLNKNNNVFLSDEATLLSNEGMVFSYPSPVRIYYYNLKNTTFPYHKITPQQKLEVIIKYFIYILSLGYAKLPSTIEAEKLFKKTGGVYPLRCLIFLKRTKDNNIDVTEITDKKELVEQLVSSNEQQFPYWLKYVSAYSSVYPASQVASYPKAVRENLSEALSAVPCYEIKAPYKFSESQREKFQQVIQGL